MTERGPVVSTSEICSPLHTIHKRKQSRNVINDSDHVDFISSNVRRDQICKSERTSELVKCAANKNRETCDGR